MPAMWYKDGKGRDTMDVRAEDPDMNPMGDGNGEGDDILGFDYKRRDRNSVFDGLRQRMDLVAVMLTVIIAGVVGYVGINIMNSTEENAGVGNTSEFSGAESNLTDGLEQFFSQLETVFIVIVLVVVIAYLMLLRGR